MANRRSSGSQPPAQDDPGVNAESETQPLLGDIHHRFEEELQEQGYTKGVLSLFLERPLTVLVVFLLFAGLIYFVATFNTTALAQSFANVPQVKLEHARLTEISAWQITVAVGLDVHMNYSSVPAGIGSWLGISAATLLGSVVVGLAQPADVKVQVAGQYSHAISLGMDRQVEVHLENGADSHLNFSLELSEVGRSDVIGWITRSLLTDESVDLLVKGVLTIRKFGLDYDVPFEYPYKMQAPKSQSWNAQIEQVKVGRTAHGGIQVDATSQVTYDAPFAGALPALKWSFKLPSCDQSLKVLSHGKSGPVAVDNQVNLTLQSYIESLPKALVRPCSEDPHQKSALDLWLSRYLDGRVNYVFLEGSSDKPILHQLLAGYDVPVRLSGKPDTEKLIDSIVWERGRFDSPATLPGQHAGQVEVSGELTVDVHLPSMLEMDRDMVIALHSLRGDIYLFYEQIRFGIVRATEWIETVTVPHDEGYEIKVFFDRVPFDVDNAAQFAKVTNELMLRGKVPIEYQALVDVELVTPIGDVALQGMYIQGHTVFYS